MLDLVLALFLCCLLGFGLSRLIGNGAAGNGCG